MIFIHFNCIPKWDSENNAEYGGAFITCWINVNDVFEAEQFARKYIDSIGWQIESIEEKYPINLSDYEDDHSNEGVNSYKSAVLNGSSFTIHTFPNEELSGGVA